VIPGGLRNARMILEADRVSAIAIVADSPAAADPPGKDECPRPAPTDKAIGACLTGVGELVEIGDNEITVRAPDTEKAITTFKVPNVVFAAPLRAADGKDELVVITRTDEPGLRSWTIVAFRFDGGKISKTIEPTPLYQVSSANARWIGTEVANVDLYVELASRADSIEVGGLLTTRTGAEATRDVVVISTVSVPRRRGKSAASDGGTGELPDAGTRAGDGSGSAGEPRPKP